MNKMKRLTSLLLLLIFCISCIFTGCGKKAANAPVEKKTVTIKDSRGESVTVPLEPKKVVVLNADAGDVIHILGESDKIIAVSNSTKFPEKLAKKEKVGTSKTPNMEKILELKPDVVIGYGYNAEKETVERFNTAGIPFVGIDCFKIKTLSEDIRTLGTIFNKKERAEEYISFMNKYLDLVKERVEKIEPEKKITAYWEGGSDYTSVSKGAGGHEVLTMAGANNVAGSEPVVYPKVSSEWIIEKNPKVIIKVAPSKVPFGYDAADCKDMKAEREKFMNRNGWQGMDAVKNGKVYYLDNKIATSARSVVSICYVAKWCYPDLFKELDPEAVHKEILEKFYKIDYKGSWVCP